MRILVTGGAGFIGTAFVRRLLDDGGHDVLCFDKLTCAGSRAAPAPHPRFRFVRGEVCDPPPCARRSPVSARMQSSISRPKAMSTARSIRRCPSCATTCSAPASCWKKCEGDGAAFPRRSVRISIRPRLDRRSVWRARRRRLVHPMLPLRSALTHAASKAASDHLVRGWALQLRPACDSYPQLEQLRPRQFPEKLIPLMIARAVSDAPLPVYGRGNRCVTGCSWTTMRTRFA